MATTTLGAPGVGFTSETIEITAKSIVALTKGQHAMLDMANSQTVAITTGGAAGTSIWNTMVDITAAGAEAFVIGVAADAIAAGGTGKFILRGIVTANVDVAVVAGSKLIPATDNQFDVSTGATGYKIVGIALEADASNLADILFDGINGFGQDGDTV